MSKVEGFDDLTGGQLKALCIKLGGMDIVNAILRDEMAVEVKKAIQKLFDKNGRRISPKGMKSAVCDSNKNFYLVQPEMKEDVHYANRLLRLYGKLGIDTNITVKQFKLEVVRLMALIQGDSKIADIANGVWLPVVLPKMEANNLGVVLEQYIKAVGKSYESIFNARKFYNHLKGTLAGEVSVVSGSRYDQLIERIKQNSVIGIYFPNPFQGFSVHADREQMETLPESFILSGLDTIIAMIMYPDVLARDYYTPGLDLAAFSWRSVDYSLRFGAGGARLDFDDADDLADAYGDYSGSLLFLG